MQIHAQDTVLSLNDCLVQAGKNQASLKAAYARYQAALEQVPQVGVLPDPALSFGYFISPVETRVGPQWARISLSQMFPWFGVRKGREEVASRQARIYFAEFVKQKNELYLEVQQHYYELYLLHGKVGIEEKLIEVLRQDEELALKKVKNAQGEMVEVLQVRLQQNETRNEIASLRDEIHSVQSMLNGLMGKPAQDKITMPEQISGASRRMEVFRDSLPGHPDFQIYREEMAVLQAQSQQNIREGRPNFSLQLNYFLTASRSDVAVPDNGRDAILPAVGVQLPIYRKGIRAKARELEHRQQAVQFQQEDRLWRLQAEFDEVLSQQQEAERRMIHFTDQIVAAERIIQLQRSGYINGQVGLEEILEMEMKKLDYEEKLLQAQVDQLMAFARVKYLIGNSGGEF